MKWRSVTGTSHNLPWRFAIKTRKPRLGMVRAQTLVPVFRCDLHVKYTMSGISCTGRVAGSYWIRRGERVRNWTLLDCGGNYGIHTIC